MRDAPLATRARIAVFSAAADVANAISDPLIHHGGAALGEIRELGDAVRAIGLDDGDLWQRFVRGLDQRQRYRDAIARRCFEVADGIA